MNHQLMLLYPASYYRAVIYVLFITPQMPAVRRLEFHRLSGLDYEGLELQQLIQLALRGFLVIFFSNYLVDTLKPRQFLIPRLHFRKVLAVFIVILLSLKRHLTLLLVHSYIF